MTTTLICPRCFTTLPISGECGVCDVDGIPPGGNPDLPKPAGHARDPVQPHGTRRVFVPRGTYRRDPFATGGLCHCGHPTRDHLFVCPNCLDLLNRSLLDVPDIVAGLDVARSRKRGVDYRSLGGPTGGTVEVALAIDADALRARDRLRLVLARLVVLSLRYRLRGHGRGVPDPRDLVGMSTWLLPMVHQFARHQEFASSASELTAALGHADTVATPPDHRQPLGRCIVDCGGRMTAVVREYFATCDTCAVTAPADMLRSNLTDSLAEQRLTATEIARTVTFYGLAGESTVERVRDRIYTWFKRGRIHRAVDLEKPPDQRFVFAEVYIQLVVDQAGAAPTTDGATRRPPHLCCRARKPG